MKKANKRNIERFLSTLKPGDCIWLDWWNKRRSVVFKGINNNNMEYQYIQQADSSAGDEGKDFIENAAMSINSIHRFGKLNEKESLKLIKQIAFLKL